MNKRQLSIMGPFDHISPELRKLVKPVLNPLEKFVQKPTRGQAIKAKCAECVGCTPQALEPGFRITIRDCKSKSCPLWQFRPYRTKEKAP